MLNVNKVSNKEVFSDYRNKEEAKAKWCYIILIGIFAFIISIMFIFIAIIKAQIHFIGNKKEALSFHITMKSDKSREMNKTLKRMLLNINSSDRKKTSFELSTIKSVDEFNLIRQWTGEKEKIILCYKGTHDKDTHNNAFETFCMRRRWLAFVLKTESRKRFGAIVFTSITERSQFHNDAKAFLFSFNNANTKRFIINQPDKAFQYNDDSNILFQFGEDLFISKDYLSHRSSESRFPSLYGLSNDKLSDLTGGERTFRVVELEILSNYS